MSSGGIQNNRTWNVLYSGDCEKKFETGIWRRNTCSTPTIQCTYNVIYEVS